MHQLTILVLCLFFYQFGNAQNEQFTKKTACGFEFSLSKKFVKSKFYNYYSNSACFDTILTNRDGVIINMRAIDKSKGGRVDSNDYAKLELEKFRKDLLQSDCLIDSTNYFSVNGIRFREIGYHERQIKPAKEYPYHKFIVFTINQATVVFISIDINNLLYKNIDSDILKTIKRD